MIAPAGGIKQSTFFDTVNERGVEQLFHVFTELHKKAASFLPAQHLDLGDLVVVDGSLIDSVLSMHWADYRSNSNKAKLHLGFNLNHGIPSKLVLTKGKSAERPRVEQLVEPGQTAVMDRGYQAHQRFDQWQEELRHFVCRIKESTRNEVLEKYPLVQAIDNFKRRLSLGYRIRKGIRPRCCVALLWSVVFQPTPGKKMGKEQ